MQQIKKVFKYGAGLSLILTLIPTLLLIVDVLQTTRHSYSNFEPKSKVFHDIAQFVGCYGLLGGCDHNALWFYVIFLVLWLVSATILYKKSEKLFSSVSERHKFIIAFIIIFPITFYVFAWVGRFVVFIVGVFQFGFV